MSDQGLRITDVVESIRKHRVMILIISFAAAVAGAVFHLAGPKKFEGRTEFVLRNAMYADRNYIYNTDTKLLDYFANEDDIDRAMMMVEADIVQWKVIQNMNLAKAYGLDISSRKGAQQLGRKFSKNFNITRTEFADFCRCQFSTLGGLFFTHIDQCRFDIGTFIRSLEWILIRSMGCCCK